MTVTVCAPGFGFGFASLEEDVEEEHAKSEEEDP